MSHRATTWLASLAPSQLTNAEFRVLFHLCDCHNPSHGCFPAQTYLRENTDLSNGGLNNALSALEAKGLIRREKRHEGDTMKRISTRYFMAFESDFAPEPSPLNGVGAISTFQGEPSPLLAQSHLHMSGVAYKAKPVSEPVKEPVTRDSDLFSDQTPQNVEPPKPDLDAQFAEFWAAFPTRPNPSSKKNSKALFAAAVKKVAFEDLLRATKAYAASRAGEDARYTKGAEPWLRGDFWEAWLTAAPEDSDPDRARYREIIRQARAAERRPN